MPGTWTESATYVDSNANAFRGNQRYLPLSAFGPKLRCWSWLSISPSSSTGAVKLADTLACVSRVSDTVVVTEGAIIPVAGSLQLEVRVVKYKVILT